VGVRPAPDAEPGRWLLRSDVGWMDLVRFGPPGFDAYVRIAFSDESSLLGDGEDPVLRSALATLAGHTTTPSVAYAAIWEGWTGAAQRPAAPVLRLRHRTMLLFTGAVDELRDAPTLAWGGSPGQGFQEPHLVWPADRAWCLACEVDEEVEFTVGCAEPAAEALAAALPGAVRRATYGEDAPLYR
jgi:hypothetical protein